MRVSLRDINSERGGCCTDGRVGLCAKGGLAVDRPVVSMGWEWLLSALGGVMGAGEPEDGGWGIVEVDAWPELRREVRAMRQLGP